MAERQVTIDNITHKLDRLFFVMGTQNPLDMAGTYPLPLVQLDRFLLRVPMSYVERETELEILRDVEVIHQNAQDVQPVVDKASIVEAQQAATKVHIEPKILEAIVDMVAATRSSSLLQFGASTRAAIMLKQSLAAYALAVGRDYTTEDDLKYMAPFVLKHRLKFQPGSGDSDEAFEEIITPSLERLIRQK